MGDPDVLPLLEFFSPGDQFRNDVVHGLHLGQDPRFHGVTSTDSRVGSWWRLDLGYGLLVEILIESAQHLRRGEDFGRGWVFHTVGRGSDTNATGAFACEFLAMSGTAH